ncbi:hypothetical protein MKW94_019557, partial [Papaver nudicaule]|nr:hypothetical protein [Papaver nudicaule]
PQGHEVRCVGRKVLLETLANELPHGTIRFCSKVVSIDEQGYSKLIHLADGSVIKTKVLIGCDGVNSIVSKWLGLQEPLFAGRTATRGHVVFKESEGHNFDPTFLQFFGDGCPCLSTKAPSIGFLRMIRQPYLVSHCLFIANYDEFRKFKHKITYAHSTAGKEIEEDPREMKQYIMKKLGKAPKQVIDVIEETYTESIVSSP